MGFCSRQSCAIEIPVWADEVDAKAPTVSARARVCLFENVFVVMVRKDWRLVGFLVMNQCHESTLELYISQSQKAPSIAR